MSSRSRRVVIILILLLLALLALFFFARCSNARAPAPARAADAPPPPASAIVGAPSPAPLPVEEVLTPATIRVPENVAAGASFRAHWKGPNNAGDYLTIVRPSANPATYENYQETRHGPSLDLVAPLEPGEWEVRYIAVRSKMVLGRALITVNPISATLTAPADVVAGTKFSVTWQGPKNTGDYLTVVAKGTPDGQYRNYTDTIKGSPLDLTAPIDPGDAEIRYMTGTHARVLARRDIRIVAAPVSLEATDGAVAGALVTVVWSGPKNAGDYITIVAKATPDGQYGNYTDVVKGSPLKVTAPIRPGIAEIRYMSGQGAKVLARRPIVIEAAQIVVP